MLFFSLLRNLVRKYGQSDKIRRVPASPPTIRNAIEHWAFVPHLREGAAYKTNRQDQRTTQAQDIDFIRANAWSGGTYPGERMNDSVGCSMSPRGPTHLARVHVPRN